MVFRASRVPCEILIEDDQPQLKETEVPMKGPMRPMCTMRLAEDEKWSLPTTWISEGALKDKLVYIHFISDLKVWCVSLATAAVDVFFSPRAEISCLGCRDELEQRD